VAAAAVGEIVPPEAEALIFAGIAPLQIAGPTEISFLDNRRYAAALDATKAGAVIVHPEFAGRVPAGSVAVICRDPYPAWARVAALFHPAPPIAPGVHKSAVVHPSAIVDPSAEIGPLVVVGDGAEIGARCRIGAGAVIGARVVIGPDCEIGELASISHALVGARVRILSGARIGQEGFGFAVTESGFLSVPQLGRVVIEDDVEVGANTTIDRGSAQDTVIGAGSRLDNLVQIGHNVQLGRACVIVAQVGISGSTIVEDQVLIGGQAGLIGHLRVGRKARIGAQAGVTTDVAAGADVVGSPAMPGKEYFRQAAVLRQLARRDGRRGTPGSAEETNKD
jgi:UDP-3-O-[3-hydroxymyristoyl] glucosamine N-acyltransferase